MSITRIGATLATLQENDKSPIITRSTAGDIVERKYNLNKAQVKSITDALTFGTVDVDYANAYLNTIRSRPVDGLTSEITLTYEPSNSTSEILPAVGTVIQEIDANPIDIPIAKVDGISEVQIQAEKNDGIEAYLSPQPIYMRTEILNSFVFSEANATGDVGKIDRTPEGLTDVATGPVVAYSIRWLVTGYTVRSVGDKYEEIKHWQYAVNGWDETIYKEWVA